MKFKKELRIFTVTFWMILLSFFFVYFSAVAYINSSNLANKEKLYLPDLQRISADKAVISVLNNKIEYEIDTAPKKIQPYEYVLVPREWRLAMSGVGALYDLLFGE